MHVVDSPITALHYAVLTPAVNTLEQLLEHEECDVDPRNRIDKCTPLHYACQLEDPEQRYAVIDSLLDAGADTRMTNKNNQYAIDLLAEDDEDCRARMRKGQANDAQLSTDIASGMFHVCLNLLNAY